MQTDNPAQASELKDKRERVQLEALKLLREWSAWMVAVQTALIGVGALFPERLPQAGSCCIKLAILCFGISIASAASVLGGIPSIAQRLEGDKSIYDISIFDLKWLKYMPLNRFCLIEHISFLLGLVALIFSVLIS